MQMNTITTKPEHNIMALIGLQSLRLRNELPPLYFDADVSALDAEAEMLRQNRELAESLPGCGRYVEDIDLKRPWGTRFVLLCDDVFYAAFIERQAEVIDLGSVALPEA